MRKSIVVAILLVSVPLAAQPSPRQRELAAELMHIVEPPAVDVDAEVMKLEAARAAVRNALIDLYASRFTEAELAELIAFYGTPTGRKLARETPALLRESLERSRAALEPVIARERDRLMPWISTMKRMREIGDALERYRIENGTYPRSLDEVAKDAWGNELHYATSSHGHHYRLISAGSDGRVEAGSREVPEDGDRFDEPLLTSDLTFDFIYTRQGFLQLPRVAADSVPD